MRAGWLSGWHPRPRALSRPLLAALALGVLVACADDPDPGRRSDATPSPSASAPPTETGSATPSRDPTATPTTTAPPPGTIPPDWLGTRVLPREPGGYGEIRPTPRVLRNRRFTLPDSIPMLPGRGFRARVTDPAPNRVIARSTWEPGCPIGRDELSWVRLTFRGFDGDRHTGELLVNAAVDDQLVEVFHDLWDADFPIEEMRITRADELDAPPTGDGNNTGAFNCRPTTGGTSYSQHAYGLAVDLNPFQNPYLKDDLVLPELASAYLDRGRVRPGMITANGPVVRAFEAIGWGWGGSWSSLKDYQHFSRNGQ